MSRELLHKIYITLGVVTPLIGVIIAIVLGWNSYVFLSDIVLLLALYTVTALGITIGYHRMLTHDSFRTFAPIRAFFAILGCMAFEGRPISWAATHIKHHAHSDEEHDPHSPLEGFFHAHSGWLFSLRNFGEARQYAPHLLEDKLLVRIDRLTLLWMALSLAIPFAIGGWTGLVWGGFVRIFLVQHVTWSVNSVCHTFGKRAFATTDESRNEWIVGLLAFGEGWHNNHHAFPQSAYHGLKWYQFDLSATVIALLEKTGLAWNVQRVSEETMLAHAQRAEKSIAVQTDLRTQLQAMLEHADQELQKFFSNLLENSMDRAETEAKRLEEFHADARKRIEKMKRFVAKANNMKRQKLMAYSAEVQRIVEKAKEEMQRRKAAMSAQPS